MILTGLIGWPVAHSKSPAMHNAAFRAAGVDGFYALLPVPPQRVGEAVAGLRALGFRGANVTVPHKRAVIPFLDELSPEARAIGAVNTILVEKDGRLVGTNTDAWGFARDLEAQGLDLKALPHRGALVLGAGGSARAVVYALAIRLIPTQILARRPEQAQALIASLAPHLPRGDLLHAHPWSRLPELAPAVGLIVNCTPVGMTPREDASPWPDHLPFHSEQALYDLVYNPPRTRLMAQAQAGGARAWNGLGMLVYQGARAWELWTGQPAPVDVMTAAVQ
ncbi:MAG TPA: shikimate dehydrogenase [Anaerolineae bacterium]|nr:shikimate dehydrogenase [Caldilineae bacterium]HID34767.1 shikimate dehydrogenase [Anaerolineae bacterium]HIQ12281.1 shikimate dehydrogenase [Caldilineales bacterium]